ncbi:hypothetical protein [Streptomyces sp. NBC_01190]|uniref:hypothetical protein n=1 Tax=Streptomyces sp. NBC_01190 TaxID=2903767 RepID=UPI00386A42D3|nr:hypothetical protein OG519_24255 [Streptomyces sp. NBC_01190]
MSGQRHPAGRRIAVLGTGAFAGALTASFGSLPVAPADLHVIGRNTAAAEAVAGIGAVRAAAAGTRHTFTAHTGALSEDEDPRPLLDRIRPDLLVVCASEQSPAEVRQRPSAWTALLRQAGFGVTLPLQASLALRVTSALTEVRPAAGVVNACFPDAVNALLHAAGLPVLCGLGNVHSLATALRTRLGMPHESRLHLLAHHAHLSAPPDPSQEALAWFDGRPLSELPAHLAALRTWPRTRINEIGAAAGATVLHALTDPDEAPYATHLPGPLGLPGGYPVTIAGRGIRLRLPPGTGAARAVAWNGGIARLDGVTVTMDGAAHFTPGTLAALRDHCPTAPASFRPGAVPELSGRLRALREHLRPR